MRKDGVCAICLNQGELSFEHVPPRRAFNNRPAVAHTLRGFHLGNAHKKYPPLLRGHGGIGRRSICVACNGKTGTWYGEAFAEWTTQCLRFASRVDKDQLLLLPFTVRPLNVLKQILTMAIAIAGHRKSWPQIDTMRRFVLQPQSMQLPNQVVIRAYFNPTDPDRGHDHLTQNRLTGSCSVLDVSTGTSVFVFAEIAFPPMGYVVYFAEPGANVSEDFTSLCDLRSFLHSYYNRETSLFLSLPVRYPFGPAPGYYPNLRDPSQRKLLDDQRAIVTAFDDETYPSP